MKRIWIIPILILSLLLQACTLKNPYRSRTTTDTTEEEQDMSTEPVYTYRSEEARALEVYLSTDDTFYQRIMSKTRNEFGDDRYEPKNLIPLSPAITPEGKEILLEVRAANAVSAMLAEMAHDGIRDVMVTSGYRSNERQSYLFDLYLKNEKKSFTDEAYACLGADYIEEKYDLARDTGLDADDALRVVLSYAAEPGKSEHQTGLCVDLINASMTELTNEFESGASFSWLADNAHRFGFILRYPKDKTDLTGYAYESWHYRYVGRDVAVRIHEEGITLEEYRESLKA
ncbi:MAG: M15 family metallopeptidase [Clostridia bacterium]|nr:M15 family metallopeptidase [Clostridia bacterium]